MTTIQPSTANQSASTNKQRPRRMARPVQAAVSCATAPQSSRGPSKLDQIEALLLQDRGTSIPAMMAASGWQAHSVRGAMAGALKKRGLTVTSVKAEGVRHYRARQEG